MTSSEILDHGLSMFIAQPRLVTRTNIMNLRVAASLAWQQEEMGGIEHFRFALRNGTPVVPPGHCCHPVELVKRGYVDGKGWPKQKA